MLCSSSHRGPAPALASQATIILLRLQSVHLAFTECLTSIHTIVSAPVLVPGTFAAAHGSFAEIRRARTQAVDECLRFLLPRVCEAEREQLGQLRECTRKTLKLSAEHIRTWDFEAIRWKWRTHQAAWKAIRSHWLDAIEQEQSVLYPLLEKYS